MINRSDKILCPTCKCRLGSGNRATEWSPEDPRAYKCLGCGCSTCESEAYIAFLEDTRERAQTAQEAVTPEQRFRRDPTFYHVVRSLENLVERCELTPSEIREAAVLACTRHEQRRIPKVW